LGEAVVSELLGPTGARRTLGEQLARCQSGMVRHVRVLEGDDVVDIIRRRPSVATEIEVILEVLLAQAVDAGHGESARVWGRVASELAVAHGRAFADPGDELLALQLEFEALRPGDFLGEERLSHECPS
jgi:hypothetical protein